MHSKEDEEPKFDPAGRAGELTPENSDAGIEAWRKDFLTDGGSDTRYQMGVRDGWLRAVQELKLLELTEAAERLERRMPDRV